MESQDQKARLFVANFPWGTTEDDLRALFADFGSVKDVRICTDATTKKSKGFGFVGMESPEIAQICIDELHDSDFNGRKLVVNVADPKGANRR